MLVPDKATRGKNGGVSLSFLRAWRPKGKETTNLFLGSKNLELVGRIGE